MRLLFTMQDLISLRNAVDKGPFSRWRFSALGAGKDKTIHPDADAMARTYADAPIASTVCYYARAMGDTE